jgi:hypothetical protein
MRNNPLEANLHGKLNDAWITRAIVFAKELP